MSPQNNNNMKKLGIALTVGACLSYIIYSTYKTDSNYLKKKTEEARKCYEIALSSPDARQNYASQGLKIIQKYNDECAEDGNLAWFEKKELNDLEKKLKEIKK